MTTVAIAALKPADSPRLHGTDLAHARALAETDADLPPILVNRRTMRVIDGMHRLHAARLNGRTEVSVQFFDGSDEDAFLLGVRSNVEHGLPLSLADRRAAAERILRVNPRLSDRAIAATAGLSPKTVGAIRRHATAGAQQPVDRIGLDGRKRPVARAEARRRAGEMVVAYPEASLRRIARESGVSIGTAHDVRRRIADGQDPVRPPGQAKPSEAPPRRGGNTGTAEGRHHHTADTRAMLEGLRRDPALRYSETGRSLLRWLSMRTLPATECRRVVTSVPPHCGTIVSRIARASAQAWLQLADEIDQRSGEGGG